MNKSEEITLLRETSRKLGRDSYTGEVLAAILPSIEADIANDVFPEVDLARIKSECIAERERCTADCAAMRKKAEADAAALVSSAREQIADARQRQAHFLNEMAEKIRRGW